MSTDEIDEDGSPKPANPYAAGWAELPSIEHVRLWEEFRPGTIEKLLSDAEIERRHRRRLDWAELGLRLLGILVGGGVVVVLGITAMHFVDNNAATQALGIFGAAAASIIGAFFAIRRQNNPPQ